MGAALNSAFASEVAFGALLTAAVVTDVRTRRIPNALVLALLFTGLVSTGLLKGSTSVLASLGASALGLAIWFPFYAFRMMGAGDVKLFAAASAWLTVQGVVRAAVLTALLGGVLGVVWFVRAHGVRFSAIRLAHAVQQPSVLRQPLDTISPAARLPYGVAMAIALAITAWSVRHP